MITTCSGRTLPKGLLRFFGAITVTCLVGYGYTSAGAATMQSTGAPGVAAEGFPGRGALLSVTPISALTREQVVDLLAATSIDTRTAYYGVDAYRIEYRSIGTDRRPITASGAVALPRSSATELRTVSFAHGTIAAKAEAGSVGPETNRLAPITFAAAGHAVVAPDYLGLGTGPG